MQGLLEKLSGKKTYGLAVLLFVLAGVDVAGFVPGEQRTALYAAAIACLVATLRAAVSKLPAETLAKIERTRELLEAISQQLPPPPAAGAALLLCCLCLPAIACAGDIRIVGPASVPAPGYPCELYIQGDLPEGTEITWDYSPRLEGLPLVESVSEQNGSIARLNTMAGSYRLVVAIAVPGQKPVLRYHNFYVPGTPYVPPAPVPPSPPVPQPQPTPIPEPVNPIPPQPADPVFDEGQFGMAAATYRAVMAVNSTNRREEALCLVKRLLFIRNSIQSGSFDSVQTIVNSLAQAFNECLPETWNSVRDKLTDRIADLLQARRLTTMQHWQTLADEALLGLTEAGKR